MTKTEEGSFYYALDEQGNKIPPTPGLRAICPCCGTEVIAHCGKIKKHHWQHKSLSNCDKWYEMTIWHLEWQNLFPLECREVVMQRGEEKHRADVKIGNLVIEFQHSSLSNHKVKERELFYGSGSNKLIWVIDGTNNRIFPDWKRHLNPQKIKPVFVVDRESNIYFEMDGYVGIPLVRKVSQNNKENKDGLPIGLVINPEYPTFIDLDEYIACPLEQSVYDMNRTTYMKKWGHRKWGRAFAQNFILVKKNDFVTAIYNIPTQIDIFDSLKLCDQKTLLERKERIRIAEIEKQKNISNLKKDEKFAKFSIDQLEKAYEERMKSRFFKKSLILRTVVYEDKYEEDEDFKKGIAVYTQAINMNPNYAEGYYGRGVLREELGDYDEAIADYSQAAILFQEQGNIEKYKEVLQRIM